MDVLRWRGVRPFFPIDYSYADQCSVSSSYSGYGKVGFDRRFRIYDISDYGETITSWKRTEHDDIIDKMILAGHGAAAATYMGSS
jgi:hypothetical protein